MGVKFDKTFKLLRKNKADRVKADAAKRIADADKQVQAMKKEQEKTGYNNPDFIQARDTRDALKESYDSKYKEKKNKDE